MIKLFLLKAVKVVPKTHIARAQLVEDLCGTARTILTALDARNPSLLEHFGRRGIRANTG